MQTLRDLLRQPSKEHDTSEITELLQSRSVEKLAEDVDHDETVYKIVRGAHEGSIGILAAINDRLIFKSKQMLKPTEAMDIDYKDIVAVAALPKLFTSKIIIAHGKEVFTFDKVTRRHAARFAKFVDAAAKKHNKEYKGRGYFKGMKLN